MSLPSTENPMLTPLQYGVLQTIKQGDLVLLHYGDETFTVKTTHDDQSIYFIHNGVECWLPRSGYGHDKYWISPICPSTDETIERRSPPKLEYLHLVTVQNLSAVFKKDNQEIVIPVILLATVKGIDQFGFYSANETSIHGIIIHPCEVSFAIAPSLEPEYTFIKYGNFRHLQLTSASLDTNS